MSTNPANEELQPLAEVEKLIHEPARLMILATLHFVESADFLFIERQTGLSRGNLSSHMRKLNAAGYIEITKEFVNNIPRTLLSITKRGREALLDYVEGMQQVLNSIKEEEKPN